MTETLSDVPLPSELSEYLPVSRSAPLSIAPLKPQRRTMAIAPGVTVPLVVFLCALGVILVILVMMERDRHFGGKTHALTDYYGTWFNYLIGINNTFIRVISPPRPIFYNVNKLFPWNERFEAAWPAIRAEALEVLRDRESVPKFHEVDSLYNKISAHDPSRSWRTFVFKFYQDFNEEAERRCPVTTELIKSVPHMHAAMFSILDPGFYIPPHRGPSASALRYHLGVIVPEEGECFIEVAGNKYSWENGKGIVFDDTYVHRVHNNTSSTRVVLFCDVLRPLPKSIMAYENKLSTSPAVRAYFSKYNKATEKVMDGRV